MLKNNLNSPFNCYMSCYVHGNGLHVGNSCIIVCLDTGMLAWLGCIGTSMCMACGSLCGRNMTWYLVYRSFFIMLVLTTPLHLYAHYMAIGYALGVREDHPKGAYGSVVLWLKCQEHRLKDAWMRATGSWIRSAFQCNSRLVWDLGAGWLMWAPWTDTQLFLYLHCFMWLESHVLYVLVGFSPGVCVLFYQPIAFLSL